MRRCLHCVLFTGLLLGCNGRESDPQADEPHAAAGQEGADPEGVGPAPVEPVAAAEQDVRPGINERFLKPDLDINELVEMFEGESREIFSSRARLARACGFGTGMDVADIGAGTGLFTFLFAQDVGAAGKVFAVDIGEPMVEFIQKRADERGMSQVEPVLGTVREVNLPAASVDGVFVCDTYHHFNFPATTLASIHAALRPGGTLVIVDFERIEGVSRDWVLGHVRAGKEVVRAEIEAAGFDFVEEIEVEGLQENYFLRFRRP